MDGWAIDAGCRQDHDGFVHDMAPILSKKERCIDLDAHSAKADVLDQLDMMSRLDKKYPTLKFPPPDNQPPARAPDTSADMMYIVRYGARQTHV